MHTKAIIFTQKPQVYGIYKTMIAHSILKKPFFTLFMLLTQYV